VQKGTTIIVEKHNRNETPNCEERKEQGQKTGPREEPALRQNAVPGAIVQAPRLVDEDGKGPSEKPHLSAVGRRV
jgi:hypothetical protein